MTRLTKKELTEILLNEVYDGVGEVPKIHAPDANYCLYSFDYITGEGYQAFNKWLFRRGILGWQHTFDCDNYAEAFRVFMQIVHAKAQKNKDDGSRKQAVAIGVIWYERDDRGGHAINIIVTKEGDNLAIKYVEPQDGKEVFLSQTEKKSIFFLLI
jgi:hypothetical protein|tara:strand:+ start:329 stop:796 length:468 start_codon:yes stop_codon:yes gene_type:complete